MDALIITDTTYEDGRQPTQTIQAAVVRDGVTIPTGEPTTYPLSDGAHNTLDLAGHVPFPQG